MPRSSGSSSMVPALICPTRPWKRGPPLETRTISPVRMLSSLRPRRLYPRSSGRRSGGGELGGVRCVGHRTAPSRVAARVGVAQPQCFRRRPAVGKGRQQLLVEAGQVCPLLRRQTRERGCRASSRAVSAQAAARCPAGVSSMATERRSRAPPGGRATPRAGGPHAPPRGRASGRAGRAAIDRLPSR